MGGFPDRSVGKESTCNAGDPGSIPGLGRSPGGGHVSLGRYIPKYFILFVAMVNGIVSLISFFSHY